MDLASVTFLRLHSSCYTIYMEESISVLRSTIHIAFIKKNVIHFCWSDHVLSLLFATTQLYSGRCNNKNVFFVPSVYFFPLRIFLGFISILSLNLMSSNTVRLCGRSGTNRHHVIQTKTAAIATGSSNFHRNNN